MNLQQATAFAELQIPIPVSKPTKTKTALQVGKRVCELAAAIGEHMVHKRLKNGHSKRHTPQSWANKWLASDEFVLAEVSIYAAAMPNPPKNPKRVKHYIKAAFSAQANEPVVIDVNKRRVGKTSNGYIPDIIYLDGKHRTTAKLQRGEKTIMAWVGVKALKKIKPPKVQPHGLEISASRDKQTRMENTYEIFATTVPSVGLAKTVNRQDSGEAGSRPVDHMHSKKKMESCGARSSGSLDSDSSTDVPEMSEGTFSEKHPKWHPDKPQMHAPGTGPGYTKRFSVDPAVAAPGAGSGPRVVNKGGSKSDYSRQLQSKGMRSGKMIREMHEDVNAEAPPGRESQVRELKKKFGEKSSAPFAIAWNQHNKSKRKHQ